MENNEVIQIVTYLAPADAKKFTETILANTLEILTPVQARILLNMGHTKFEKLWRDEQILPYTGNKEGKIGKGINYLFERKELMAYLRSTKAKVK
jgi:hypothetical protein